MYDRAVNLGGVRSHSESSRRYGGARGFMLSGPSKGNFCLWDVCRHGEGCWRICQKNVSVINALMAVEVEWSMPRGGWDFISMPTLID